MAPANDRPQKSQDAVTALNERETELWRSWGRARHRLTRLIDESMVQRTGLTMVEFASLEILYSSAERRTRLSDISARCGLSQSRISRLADTLERRGLARRNRDDNDGRGAILALTDSGLARYTTALPHHNSVARHFILDHIPAEQFDLFMTVITTIAATDTAFPTEPPG